MSKLTKSQVNELTEVMTTIRRIAAKLEATEVLDAVLRATASRELAEPLTLREQHCLHTLLDEAKGGWVERARREEGR